MFKRRKIFIPKGYFSLLLLFVICISYLRYKDSFKKEGVLKLVILSKGGNLFDFNLEDLKEIEKQKKFEVIVVTQNTKKNQIILKEASLKLDDIVSSKDTVKGIHFRFTDNSTYANFIDVITLCKKNKINSIIQYESNIWVWWYEPIKEIEFEGYTCYSGSLYDEEYEIEKALKVKEYKRQQAIEYIIVILKKYYLIELILVLMIVMNVFKIIKHKKRFN